ncbi:MULTISPECIES: FAD-dependent oxidoreductase [unclassified Streptomyces]|uniref:FAD-dependent oxidoreductase n=1 Tax=unclassified Streptomyces TaxID=2593676 RepID=UPI003319E7F1
MSRRVVIIGNGPAGHRLAELLCARAPGTDVTILGAESEPAYNRVLLASVLAGRLAAEATYLARHPEGSVRVLTGVRVESIDRRRQEVRTGEGMVLPYDDLVLATGAACFLPPVQGLTEEDGRPAKGVVALRTLADCRLVEDRLPVRGSVAVLGGGVLGLEVARALSERGYDVDVVHGGPHAMDRQLGPAAGDLLATALDGLSVRVLAGRMATAWTGDRLTLRDGSSVAAGLLIVCAGVVPETSLARDAGLRVERGVVVDEYLRTSDPRIHALGDCAEAHGEVSGLIAPAWEQADVLAGVLAGEPRPYAGTRTITRLKARGVDLAVIGAGESEVAGAETVVLTDPARGQYARLSVLDTRVVGAVLLGLPDSVAAVSQLYDSEEAAPNDRLSLLMGRAVAGPAQDPGSLPGQTVICRCSNVTKNDLATAWLRGAREESELAEATRATTGCGGCRSPVKEICRWLRAKHEQPDADAARSGDEQDPPVDHASPASSRRDDHRDPVPELLAP